MRRIGLFLSYARWIIVWPVLTVLSYRWVGGEAAFRWLGCIATVTAFAAAFAFFMFDSNRKAAGIIVGWAFTALPILAVSRRDFLSAPVILPERVIGPILFLGAAVAVGTVMHLLLIWVERLHERVGETALS